MFIDRRFSGGEAYERFQHLFDQRWSHLHGWSNIKKRGILGACNSRSYKITSRANDHQPSKIYHFPASSAQ